MPKKLISRLACRLVRRSGPIVAPVVIPVSLVIGLGIGLLAGIHEAQAGRYDIDLATLGSINMADGSVVSQRAQFRSLSSELGVVMAAKPIDPSDSLGLSGFAISADISLNTIQNERDYWTTPSTGNPERVVPTLQILGRKGLWPGIEVGAGATKLFDSRMWTLSSYGKIALHEGFHHLPIPSIALRGMVSKVLGAKDLNMLTASLDASLSHVFGVGNTLNLTPYAGYQLLFVIARSNVLDATPGTDEYPDDFQDPPPCSNSDPNVDPCIANEFVFSKQTILRHRPFVGLRIGFSVFRVALEAMIAPKGKSSETIDGRDISDGAGFQQQYTLSIGLDF